MNLCHPIQCFTPDTDVMVAAKMIHGVVQIIGHNFLDLEFIPHNHQGFRHIYAHLCRILLNEDAGGIDQVMHQLRDIKGCNARRVVSKFQGRQGQKLAYHLVHLVGLIHDDLTVITAAFFILAHAVAYPLRIALDQGNRCFQFMGDIGNELFSHLIDLDLLVNVVLQLFVGILQGTNSIL